MLDMRRAGVYPIQGAAKLGPRPMWDDSRPHRTHCNGTFDWHYELNLPQDWCVFRKGGYVRILPRAYAYRCVGSRRSEEEVSIPRPAYYWCRLAIPIRISPTKHAQVPICSPTPSWLSTP